MSTKDLIDAIAANDSQSIEATFASAMADKISVKLDAMRQNVAQNMFKEQPAATVEVETEQEEITTDE